MLIVAHLYFLLTCLLSLAYSLPENIGPYPLNLTTSGSRAPSLPLAVRNPYLSAWLPGSQANNLPTAQAEFWTGKSPLGWTILAQVNGKTFTLFGAPHGIQNITAAKQRSIRYSATHTIAELVAGSASIVVDFFSPVSPNNHLRQSFPFSYVTITVTGSSNVQVLSAIDGSWYGQPGHLMSRYQNKEATSVMSLADPQALDYKEVNDMAAWGSIVHATSQAGNSSVSYQSGPADTVFGRFVKSGTLDRTLPTYTRGNWVAFAQNLRRTSSNSPSSVTFAVGQYRDHVISYLDKDQVGFFKSKYSNLLDTVEAFLDDYPSAYVESQTLDKAIHDETISISSNYTDLTTAAVRQCYGAMEVTLPADDTADTSNPYVFLKEISTNGDANTIDVVFPTATILGVMSPDWIKFLLEPVATYSESQAWTEDYVVHDLGTYPVATGRTKATSESMFLQNTGSFLIMACQYQTLTGDKTWAQSHEKLFQKFADYLAAKGLYPPTQFDTVDSISPIANQTNLAIISAISLKAYRALTGNQNYTQKAQSFADTIYKQGQGTDLYSANTPTQIIPGQDNSTPAKGNPKHFTYNYGHPSSWGTVFPLFPDQHLNLTTFPSEAITMQCSWYVSQATSVGIPYASFQDDIANGMWDMWIAATCPNDVDTMIGFEHAFFTNGRNNVPFPDRYHVKGPLAGTYVAAHARSALGTTFALLLGKGVDLRGYSSMNDGCEPVAGAGGAVGCARTR